ncbi:MAG: ABC transporter ATP-binding protein [Thermodesulfobacteriota bacterium]
MTSSEEKGPQSELRDDPTGAVPVLEVQGLLKRFPIRRGLLQRTIGFIHAVDGIDLRISQGRSLGLVGESGCGKSTVARLILRLLEPDGGKILLRGQDITRLSPRQMLSHRRQMQIVFQDPYGSLNPRMTVGQSVEEGLRALGIHDRNERRRRVSALLERVGLPSHTAKRYPHEFSGGQRQRIGIARALAVEPSLVVCDEPVSALDVSVQSQIVNLLKELQDDLGLSYLFISHDLNLVQYFSDEVAVMYGGQIMEYAPAEELQRRPYHPYSQGLVAAIPAPDPEAKGELPLLRGEIAAALDPPPGCRFQGRCPLVEDRCLVGAISYYRMSSHMVRCWKVAGG